MRRVLFGGAVLLMGFLIFTILYNNFITLKIKPVNHLAQTKPPILEEYSYPNLKTRNYLGTPIELNKVLKEDSEYTSYLFSYLSDGKKITGQVNLPKTQRLKDYENKFPVIVMLRGYVDKEIYKTGDGTRKAAAYFASHGFITLAPDFLGYGGSDEASPDSLKARFQTYVSAVNLIKSVNSLPLARKDQVFLWGHSNGGQIALSVLEITGKNYPTVLWAPVSKPFPYSILVFSDEASDSGKLLRKIVADFDNDYDANEYSLTNYLRFIQAPILLQQGVADDVVWPRWSREFAQKLEMLNKEVEYLEYPGEDHNFSSGSWSKVAAQDLDFYRPHIK